MVHIKFADWYNEISLRPTAETLEARWKAIEAVSAGVKVKKIPETRMTQKAIRKIKALRVTTIRYSSRVKREGPKTSKYSETAFSQSAAKYYPALKKLASE